MCSMNVFCGCYGTIIEYINLICKLIMNTIKLLRYKKLSCPTIHIMFIHALHCSYNILTMKAMHIPVFGIIKFLQAM